MLLEVRLFKTLREPCQNILRMFPVSWEKVLYSGNGSLDFKRNIYANKKMVLLRTVH